MRADFIYILDVGGRRVVTRIKILALAVCAVIPAIMTLAAYNNSKLESTRDYTDPTFGLRLERVIRNSFPFSKQLLDLRNLINISGGRREIVTQVYGLPIKQNGIFVSENSLMKNIDEPVESYVDQNIESIAVFADELRQDRVQTYFMLIPTSGAILQQNLPPYADSVMVNQRRFIDDVYNRISGSVTTIDVYSPLFAARNQYIYYRTENNLTSQGGFYIYSAMLPRLQLGQAQLNRFDVEYIAGSFYGDLAKESGYTSLSPDIVSLLRYSLSNRYFHEFMVTHKSAKGEKTYHTLYPKHLSAEGEALDIFLGGMSPVTDIFASTEHTEKILLFADRTAISYVPLLANNCERLTVVNLSSYNFMLNEINPVDYDKAIFAFSTESFMQMPEPSRAASYFFYDDWAES